MSVSVSDLNDKAKHIKELRDKETELSNLKKVATTQLEEAEREFLEILTAEGMDSFRSPVGLLSITHRTSVQTPKTPEDKAKFFAHLKAQGLYDQMVSVNSQTLNSYYKDQLEQAKKRGDADLEIPGISGVTITPNLSFRK
jgi:hypothetical protein